MNITREGQDYSSAGTQSPAFIDRGATCGREGGTNANRGRFNDTQIYRQTRNKDQMLGRQRRGCLHSAIYGHSFNRNDAGIETSENVHGRQKIGTRSTSDLICEKSVRRLCITKMGSRGSSGVSFGDRLAGRYSNESRREGGSVQVSPRRGGAPYIAEEDRGGSSVRKLGRQARETVQPTARTYDADSQKDYLREGQRIGSRPTLGGDQRSLTTETSSRPVSPSHPGAPVAFGGRSEVGHRSMPSFIGGGRIEPENSCFVFIADEYQGQVAGVGCRGLTIEDFKDFGPSGFSSRPELAQLVERTRQDIGRGSGSSDSSAARFLTARSLIPRVWEARAEHMAALCLFMVHNSPHLSLVKSDLISLVGFFYNRLLEDTIPRLRPASIPAYPSGIRSTHDALGL